MRASISVVVTSLVVAAFAQTSPDFPIAVTRNLRVVYNDSNSEVTPPGILINRSDVLSAPTAYLPDGAPSNATYVLFMIDIDVPRNGSRTNLLHWLEPNLVAQPSALVRDNTTVNASTAVGAAYIPPTPPGGSGPHRYNFLLFEQPSNWAIPAAFVSINPPASSSARIGFNIVDFVSQSGLGEPVAANYLRVLNGTAAESSSASTQTGSLATATSSGAAMASASGTATGVEQSGSMASTAVASATSAVASATPTGAAAIVKVGGNELMASIALAFVGITKWML